MVCKYFLPFHRLPFHFVIGFLCYAEALQFGVVPLVYFCFCGLCFWCQIQKIIAKTDVKKLSPCFLLGVLQFLILHVSL